MTTTTANAVIAAAARPVFYTREDAAVKVALWKSTRSEKSNAPVLTGNIAGVKVAGFLQQGPKGLFLSFVAEKKQGSNYDQVATANVVAGHMGYPKLLLKMADKSQVWADTSKLGTHELLSGLGLNVQMMLDKQAKAQEGRKAAASEAPAPAPEAAPAAEAAPAKARKPRASRAKKEVAA